MTSVECISIPTETHDEPESFSAWAEFNDRMLGAWCCGTTARGYRRAWEPEPFYDRNAATRHADRDFGAAVWCKPGEYVVVKWEADPKITVDVYLRHADGSIEHVRTVDNEGDRVREAVEVHRGIPSKKRLPIVPGRFTETLPIGAAFVDAQHGVAAQVYRVTSRAKKSMVFVPINFSALVDGETLHAPAHADFSDVLRERPRGNCENDVGRRRMTDDEKAMIPAGVTLLEYPDRW